MNDSIPAKQNRWWIWGLPVLWAIMLIATYANTLSSPLVFDSLDRIQKNQAIRSLGSPWGWLTYDRRPVAYFTFALNYAFSQLDVTAYRVTNLTIHFVASLFLFGLVLRTLQNPRSGGRYAEHATVLAAAVAAIWAIHPLQTQAVTYVVQRIESLMGCLFLGTLYCFVRGASGNQRHPGWSIASLLLAYLAVATKEVAAMLPLVVVWYDRAFLSGSWRELWYRRRGYYSLLCGSWGVLAYLMITRGETYGDKAGFGTDISSLDYFLTQPAVILRYLQLCVWPAGQCLDYGWPVSQSLGEVLPSLAVVSLLAGATVLCIWRFPAWSFVGGSFFLILAPTSSFVPIADVIFEHRMYLPLAAVTVLFVLGVWELCGVLVKRLGTVLTPRLLPFGILMGAVVISLSLTSRERNEVYASKETMWYDVTVKAPWNGRAHYNLGTEYLRQLRWEEAERSLRTAGELIENEPYLKARQLVNLGLVLWHQDELEESVECFESAAGLSPDDPDVHANYGPVLQSIGKTAEAKTKYHRALSLDPNHPFANSNLGLMLIRESRYQEAMELIDRALRSDPYNSDAHLNRGLALVNMDAARQAEEAFETSLRLNPFQYRAYYNLGILYHVGNPDLAEKYYRKSLEIAPEFSEGYNNLGVLLEDRRPQEALESYRRAVETEPRNAQAHLNLADLLERSGKPQDAIRYYRQALKINPDMSKARAALSRLTGS